MLALEFRFLAGRYHATPWGRHVNEGDVAWPPEPWRILRGLIATWHHKVRDTGRHEDAVLSTLIATLAETPPQFHLPPANHSHTRHYMPQWKAGDTSLVLDAFAAVQSDTPMYLRWPELDLPYEQAKLLDDLLSVMGYLGRAESWVEARRVESGPEPNCLPGSDPIDMETGELHGEVVSVHAPVTSGEYDQRRWDFLANSDEKQARRLAGTLPKDLVSALSLDTADLQKQGWSDPPAAQKISYIRPVDALRPRRKRTRQSRPAVTTAQFLLIGKPLPRVEDTLRIGELLRWSVMSAFGKDENGLRLAPPLFSGHDLPDNNLHRHAFYLPYDSNHDGFLDRVLVHVPDSFDEHAQRTVSRLRRVWQRNGGEWRLLLEGMGNEKVNGELTTSSQFWRSVTPYLHPWHVKKKFNIADQIRRECAARANLPEITELKRVQTINVGNQERRPIHFHRFRTSKRSQHQPDRSGSFWEITFAEPVTGPLALGFACHFGLGLFRPNQF